MGKAFAPQSSVTSSQNRLTLIALSWLSYEVADGRSVKISFVEHLLSQYLVTSSQLVDVASHQAYPYLKRVPFINGALFTFCVKFIFAWSYFIALTFSGLISCDFQQQTTRINIIWSNQLWLLALNNCILALYGNKKSLNMSWMIPLLKNPAYCYWNRGSTRVIGTPGIWEDGGPSQRGPKHMRQGVRGPL